MSEGQCGFRKYRNRSDEIFVLREKSEKMMEREMKDSLAFMYLGKYTTEWQVLEIYGVGGKVLAVIESFRELSSTCVRVAGSVTSCFSVNNSLMKRREVSS